MGCEERGVRQTGIIVPLGVILGSNGYVVGLTFNDDERRFAVGFVLCGTPDNKVGACLAGASPGDFLFFGNLFQVVAVFVEQDEKILLSDILFRRLDKPLLADWTPYFAVFSFQLRAVLRDVGGTRGVVDPWMLHVAFCFLYLFQTEVLNAVMPLSIKKLNNVARVQKVSSPKMRPHWLKGPHHAPIFIN